MKRVDFPGSRHPLQEKIFLGSIPCRRCFVCGHRVIEQKEPVSGVKWTFYGFKYINGIDCMLVQESTYNPVAIYEDELLDRQMCLCTTPDKYLAPVGTIFNAQRPFSSLNEERPINLFSPVFTEYSPYVISTERIIRGLDTRTTCMIKNIPNKLTSKQLVVILSSICFNSFDFVYLRMDFKSHCNNGYAFINFRQPKYIPIFQAAIQGKRWKNFKSEKRGDIAYARIQGLPMLQNRFKRSDILSASREYWPLIFNTQGEEILASEWKAPAKHS
ncbi:hypothetical protein NEHOM01_2280 [Nematocida homosporus]|uniref:uncharacterized protein n=1 Tax=Nematocida homosporus TaxID=1912981 RepID=UPI00221F7330|nr:uncharacterized protein NEHOM01_2280 [Nematocida homosporus]KAI5187572.1 hypothetical protein NEHOM01_2280 [Nematocida homosporus]